MSLQHRSETIETHGCRFVLRRVEGPEATELFLHGQPTHEPTSEAREQADALYRALLTVLAAEGAGAEAIVSQTIFLRSLRTDLAAVRSGRDQALGGRDTPLHRPATSEIEQPPLCAHSRLEISAQALLPHSGTLQLERFHARSPCGCEECAGLSGLRVHLGAETRLYASGLFGAGETAYERTHALFALAEDLLQQAGMGFGDVVRTWIHLREMERDYAALNRARREFFEARGIDPAPASTGIGGGPAAAAHDLCLGFYAVAGGRTTAMTTPTLNEAPLYGSDFARGMRIEEANKVALHVSGTASIDEAGRTVHREDIDAQADRMLVNVAALLERQGASFDDVVSAITYLKDPADADRLRARLRDAGYAGFPHALVVAPVCRPELLCETEALAVLPHPRACRA